MPCQSAFHAIMCTPNPHESSGRAPGDNPPAPCGCSIRCQLCSNFGMVPRQRCQQKQNTWLSWHHLCMHPHMPGSSPTPGLHPSAKLQGPTAGNVLAEKHGRTPCRAQEALARIAVAHTSAGCGLTRPRKTAHACTCNSGLTPQLSGVPVHSKGQAYSSHG
jgi:hypothetical protein